jgi:hypothetical protein
MIQGSLNVTIPPAIGSTNLRAKTPLRWQRLPAMKSTHVVAPQQRADTILEQNKYNDQPQQEKTSARASRKETWKTGVAGILLV